MVPRWLKEEHAQMVKIYTARWRKRNEFLIFKYFNIYYSLPNKVMCYVYLEAENIY